MKSMPDLQGAVLVCFHCAPGTGFAIGRLERVFFRMALALTGDENRIYFSYPNYVNEGREPPPVGAQNILRLDPSARSVDAMKATKDVLKKKNIKIVLVFDQQPRLPIYRFLREVGVEVIASYWGAPMSSINRGLRLFLKQWQVMLDRYGPDHYIFESEAMRRTAIRGRGVAKKNTSVIRLGVNTNQFRPVELPSKTAFEVLGIPKTKRIVFYSGHMEPRKGVHVIVKAAVELLVRRQREDIAFVLLGNRDGDELQYKDIYKGTAAEGGVFFGGYRDDIQDWMQSASVGVIASVGWDSFTRTAVELMATGVPLIVSDLQGLSETVEHGVTGFTFEPGDARQLADRIELLIDSDLLRKDMSRASRVRALREFCEEAQVQNLEVLCRRLLQESVGRSSFWR